MQATETCAAQLSTADAALARITLPLFSLAIFLSALLLFAIEPMFTKIMLPLSGGSPSVWSIALVFFQALMLAGYCYAWALTSWLPARVGAVAHLGVMAMALACLPIAPRFAGSPPSNADPTLWLIAVFGSSIGLPFFALSAQGPLLQFWFSRANHRHARDPYFLYAASNLGSFVALPAYPFVIEPLVGLSAQSAALTTIFLTIAALVALSALASLKAKGTPVHASLAVANATQRVNARSILGWIALSFTPSALLVAATAHISTDIAAAPLAWSVCPRIALSLGMTAWGWPPPGGGRAGSYPLGLKPWMSWIRPPFALGLNR